MCRLAAFPPMFPRAEAIKILMNFERCNTDGFGSAYIKDGKFVVDKAPKALSKVFSRGYPFLSHMPYPGWTIAHLRAASHGSNLMKNTHPFVIGDTAFMHNGVWSDYNLVKLGMEKFVKIVGDTDSEVAGNLFNLIGLKRFSEEITFGGVFVSLRLDGSLQIAKTSGDLEIVPWRNGTDILASEFDPENPKYKDKKEAFVGWYKYDRNGRYVKHKAKEYGWSSKYRGYSGVTSHNALPSAYMGGNQGSGGYPSMAGLHEGHWGDGD